MVNVQLLALCEYDKYYRIALGIPTREREYSDSKSNQYIDDDTNDVEWIVTTSGLVGAGS